jgi:hypothetical protein
VSHSRGSELPVSGSGRRVVSVWCSYPMRSSWRRSCRSLKLSTELAVRPPSGHLGDRRHFVSYKDYLMVSSALGEV